MSVNQSSTDLSYYTPESRSYHKSADKGYSGEKYSPRRERRSSRSRSNSRERSYRGFNDDKEKLREYYRDRKDFSRGTHNYKSDFAGAKLNPVNWGNTQLIPVQKCFYNEHPNVKGRSVEEVEKFRKENRITIRSKWAPNPIFSFEEGQFPSYINETIQKCGYKKPTPIQSQGWPCALSGNDVIGIAQTGSGKTLSFLIPGIIHINSQSPLQYGDGPIGLVLAPTRELAMQIHSEAEKFGRNANIRSACIYGGVEKYPQQKELQRGVHLVIACPGRLLDFLEMGVVNLRRVTYLVLDEADRMLDMGFEPQIRRILSQVRPDRQTLMWSATWPREVQQLALEFCKQNPIHVVIGDTDLTVNSCIKQHVEFMEERMKESRVIKLLENITDGSKILIFCQTKRGCDILADTLKSEHFKAISLHGDKSQNQRDYVMKQFKSGRYNILVATDIAARGLDVSDIYYVINYDFPQQLEDYIHRVGRTGRAGRKGVSYTFFTRENSRHASSLIDILEQTEQKVPQELYRLARRPIPIKNDYTSSNTQQKSSTEEQKHSSNTWNNNSTNTWGNTNKSWNTNPTSGWNYTSSYNIPNISNNTNSYSNTSYINPTTVTNNTNNTGYNYKPTDGDGKNGDSAKKRFSYDVKPESSVPGFYYGNQSNMQQSYTSMNMLSLPSNYYPNYTPSPQQTPLMSNMQNVTMTPSTNVSNSTPKQTSQPGSAEKQTTNQTMTYPNDAIFKAFFSYNFASPIGVPGGQQAENGVNNTNNNNNYSWYFLRQLNGQPAMPNYEKPSQPDNSTK